MRLNKLTPALPLPTSSRGFDMTAAKRQLLHTHLGRLSVSVSEGRFGPGGGWLAQLHSDLPGLAAVGDVIGATEREALAGLALAIRRHGRVPVA